MERITFQRDRTITSIFGGLLVAGLAANFEAGGQVLVTPGLQPLPMGNAQSEYPSVADAIGGAPKSDATKNLLIAMGVPVPSDASVGLATGEDASGGGTFQVFANGEPTGHEVLVISRTRSDLALHSHSLHDWNGDVVALAHLHSQVGSAVLVHGNEAKPVLLFIHVLSVEPLSDSSEPYTVTNAVLIGEAQSLQTAAKFVQAIDAWQIPVAIEQKSGPAVSTARGAASCKATCDQSLEASKSVCDALFRASVSAELVTAFTAIDGPSFALCALRGPDSAACTQTVFVDFGATMGPTFAQSVDAAAECLSTADQDHCMCVTALCGLACW